MTHPNHETALMLLRAAGFDVGDGENILFSTNVEWRLIKNDILAMAAAVDAKMEAREKALRKELEAAKLDAKSANDALAAFFANPHNKITAQPYAALDAKEKSNVER